jgi:DNA replication protein DnaC
LEDLENPEITKPEQVETLRFLLTKWAREEKLTKQDALVASKIRSARFVKLQTIDAFHFKHSQMTQKIQKSYRQLFDSIARDNLPCAIFSGNAGTGKTHLARSIGYGACQKGLSVLFTTAAEMVNQLAHAQKNYTLEKELYKYRKPQVLIVDELGYVSLDTQASNLFFQVISNRHDQELGTIATTNLPFGKFNQIFANDAIAHAIVDRLVNDAEVFYMEGDSYRPLERQVKMRKRKRLQENADATEDEQ